MLDIAPIAEQAVVCDASTAQVEQILMIASHVTCPTKANNLDGCSADPHDATLLTRYVQELRAQPNTAAWLLLYREGYDRFTRVHLGPSPRSPTCQSCANPTVSVWGDQAVWRRFPRLEQAVRTHPHIHKEATYLQRYYWFHASLAVWHDSFGACYPRLKYIWRLEPDVLFAGTMDQLVDLSSTERADVLLPEVQFASNGSVQSNHYHHFAYQTFLDDVPPERVAWSLVSIGRYSMRFIMQNMASRWAVGVSGYEEILLPTSCLITPGCRVASFNGWDSVAANHVVFRTADPGGSPRFWHCEEFKEARTTKDGTLDLWHPVKDHSCLPDSSQVAMKGCPPCSARMSPAVPSAAEWAASLRALRRKSVAWADRFRDREAHERPFLAQRRDKERQRLAEIQNRKQ